MKVLTAAQMNAFDRWAVEEVGLSVDVLMENAAIGVADAVMECAERVSSVCVLCGPGNNGADGYAVARQLLTRGVNVHVFQVGGVVPESPLAQQREILVRLGAPIEDGVPNTARLGDFEVVIDALFGTGLSRPLEGDALQAVVAINGSSRFTVCVDLPSGLFASNGAVAEEDSRGVVQGDLTVCFARPKIAHISFPAAAYCGEVVVADLGVFYRRLGDGPWQNTIDQNDVHLLLRPRPEHLHKGSFGDALIVAGSSGMVGAALLATTGALRSGAGLVHLAVPRAIAAVAMEVPEAMTIAVGANGSAAFSDVDLEAIRNAADGCSSLTIGPGLGRSA